MKRAFADSSVLLGFLDDQAHCVELHRTFEWITSHAHLLEVYSILKQRTASIEAGAILQDLMALAVPVPDDAVAAAADIRLALRSQRKDCSYIDALGYGIARSHGIPLLIADDSFQGVQGAQHVTLRPRPSARRAGAR